MLMRQQNEAENSGTVSALRVRFTEYSDTCSSRQESTFPSTENRKRFLILRRQSEKQTSCLTMPESASTVIFGFVTPFRRRVLRSGQLISQSPTYQIPKLSFKDASNISIKKESRQ